MNPIHQDDYNAIGTQHEQVTGRINDMLIELQNHSYATGVERGKALAKQAAIEAGTISPTLCQTIHLGQPGVTVEPCLMLGPADDEVACLLFTAPGNEVRLTWPTQTQALAVLAAATTEVGADAEAQPVTTIDLTKTASTTASNTNHTKDTAMTHTSIPTAPGTPFEGGFYAGRFQINGDEYALIVSPKEAGEIDGAQWGEYGQAIPATSYCDGLANTQAMAEAGSELAKQLLTLQIGEHNDWYLPSRDELELCYRNLKPTTRENYASFRDGDNPSSVPPGLPYTEEAPAQTTVAAFQAGGSEAFEEAWYWASTQYSPYHAWNQYFDDGGQGDGHKDGALRARAVRRFKVTH